MKMFCLFFLLSKKLLVISYLAGHRRPESLSNPLSLLGLHPDGHHSVCPFPCRVFSQTLETVSLDVSSPKCSQTYDQE